MRLGAPVERIGLTQLGIKLWFGMRAIFNEHMVESGRQGGEPMFRGSPKSPERINAGWNALWREAVGIPLDPIYVEVLGELLDRPRRPGDVVQRIVKREPSIQPVKVSAGVEALFQAGVLTSDERLIYIA